MTPKIPKQKPKPSGRSSKPKIEKPNKEIVELRKRIADVETAIISNHEVYTNSLIQNNERLNEAIAKVDSHSNKLDGINILHNVSSDDVRKIAIYEAREMSQRSTVYGITWGTYLGIIITLGLMGNFVVATTVGIIGLIIAGGITAGAYLAPKDV